MPAPVVEPSPSAPALRLGAPDDAQDASYLAARSEERRVGKECRSRCDWSSDVYSSDLVGVADAGPRGRAESIRAGLAFGSAGRRTGRVVLGRKIGRASCRERV